MDESNYPFERQKDEWLLCEEHKTRLSPDGCIRCKFEGNGGEPVGFIILPPDTIDDANASSERYYRANNKIKKAREQARLKKAKQEKKKPGNLTKQKQERAKVLKEFGISPTDTRFCNRCKTEKTIDRFQLRKHSDLERYRRKGSKNIFRSPCYDCKNESRNKSRNKAV